MTIFDYIVLAIVGFSLLFGLWRGVVGEVIALLAWALAAFAAVEFGVIVGQRVFDGVADPAMRTLAGCVLIVVGVLVAMALVRMAVRSMIQALGLSVSDRLLGMLFGIARGVLVALVLVALGGMTAAPQQGWWRQATLAPALEIAVLTLRPWLPEELAKRIKFS